MRKVNSRKDRYNIKESMNVEEGWDRITEEMKKFDAVFLCDIHSPLRNKLVKFCYAEGIRSYITPKISDIIIRSSENIHFFDTPLLLSRNNDMSVVGPRPERVEHVEQYTAEVPEFSYRLKVKGGLTGYAQIYGKYNTTAYDKLKLDLMYIQNYSILLDLKLIIMTGKILFVKESTEGFEEKK